MSSNPPDPSATTLNTIFGVVNSAKQQWNNSGANAAVSKVSASIPESTKSYISRATGKIFRRDKLRSVSVCFGIGEERPFYVEKVPSLLIDRIKHNLKFFYMNYLLMVLVLFCLTLVISPSAIIGIALLGGAWVYVGRAAHTGTLKIGNFKVTESQATMGMGVVSAFVLLWLLEGVMKWALISSGFLTAVHALLRDASMHQDFDGDNNITMMGGEVEFPDHAVATMSSSSTMSSLELQEEERAALFGDNMQQP